MFIMGKKINVRKSLITTN